MPIIPEDSVTKHVKEGKRMSRIQLVNGASGGDLKTFPVTQP